MVILLYFGVAKIPIVFSTILYVIAIVNVVNVCYCGMLLRRRARNLMIHVVHLKVNFHRLKISVFYLDRAVCKILNSGSPWVIASHKGWTIHPGRTTNL